jgi:hypothetical protein
MYLLHATRQPEAYHSEATVHDEDQSTREQQELSVQALVGVSEHIRANLLAQAVSQLGAVGECHNQSSVLRCGASIHIWQLLSHGCERSTDAEGLNCSIEHQFVTKEPFKAVLHHY